MEKCELCGESHEGTETTECWQCGDKYCEANEGMCPYCGEFDDNEPTE